MKITTILTKYLPILVLVFIGLGILVGNSYPEEMKELKPFIPIPLFFMLYPMMITLQIEEVKKAIKSPKIILSAILLNFVISPPLGALFAYLFFHGYPSLLAVGFILNMVTPCSGMVAAWTGFAKGKVETAVVIVAVSFLMAIFMIPFWLYILVRQLVDVPVFLLLKQLVYIIVLPMIAGFATRKYLIGKMGEERFLKIKPTFPAISSLGMYAIIFISMALEAKTTLKYPEFVLLLVVSMTLYYLLMFGISVLYSKLAKIDFENMVALAYGTTAKNLSITIAIAVATFGGLAILSPAFDPPIQIISMMAFLYAVPHIKKWFVKKTEIASTDGKEII